MTGRETRQSLVLLRDALRVFARERDWGQFHTPKNLSMALSVEIAEIVEIFQWLTPKESATLPANKREELADELGDALIYLVRLADVSGIDLLVSANRKLAKNRAKYPVAKSKGSAKKYDEL